MELVLPLGIDKGSVVRELCDGLARAAFLGDDAGDLLAFRALDELGTTSGLRTLKVAVTGDERPAGAAAGGRSRARRSGGGGRLPRRAR